MARAKIFKLYLMGVLFSILFSFSAYCEEQPATIEFRLICDEAGPSCEKMIDEDTQKELFLQKQPQLSIGDLNYAIIEVDKSLAMPRDNNKNKKSLILKDDKYLQPPTLIYLKFNKEATKKLERITSENVGKRMGIVIDGKLLMAPRIKEPIDEGGFVIDSKGHMAKSEAEDLARRINKAIALKVPQN